MSILNDLRDITNRVSNSPGFFNGTCQNDGTDLINNSLSPGGVGEGTFPIPIPECKHTKLLGKSTNKPTINYRKNCLFDSWKNYKEKDSFLAFRRVQNTVYLASIKPTETQPDFITIILYGWIYQVKTVNHTNADLVNLVTLRTAVTSSRQMVHQVEIKTLPAFDQLTMF